MYKIRTVANIKYPKFKLYRTSNFIDHDMSDKLIVSLLRYQAILKLLIYDYVIQQSRHKIELYC